MTEDVTTPLRYRPMEWLQQAACRGKPIEWFFPGRGGTITKGLACCSRCPVKIECYDYAVETGTVHGVWGGVNFDPRLDQDPTNLARNPHLQEKQMAASLLHQNLEDVKVTPVEVKPRHAKVTPVIPRTLSASSIQTYLECPAKFRAMYIDGGSELPNDAADLGTVCHGALEDFVANGAHTQTDSIVQRDILRTYYGENYWRLFTTDEYFEEGWKLVKDWLKRQDWSNREVLATEEKKTFPLKVYAPDGTLHEIPFVYIMDREDRLIDSGDIEVWDYKSLRQPINHKQLRQKIQARLYGLAAQIAHPEANRIWVTFDMLRFDPIGIVFTKDDNRETWEFLKRIAAQIVADDQAEETLGEGCRYCVRANVCETLAKHVKVGGPLSVTDPAEAARKLYEIRGAQKGLENIADTLEKLLIAEMQNSGVFAIDVPGLEVQAGVNGRRVADGEMVRQVVGDEIYAEISGNPSVKQIDLLLKDERLTTEQKSQLAQCLRMNYGDTKVTIKKASELS